MVPHNRPFDRGIYNPDSSREDDHHHSSNSHAGLIVGIVFAVVGSIAIASLGWFMMIRRKKSTRMSECESSIHASRVGSIAQDEEPPDVSEYPGDHNKTTSNQSVASIPSSIHSIISSAQPSIHSVVPSLVSQHTMQSSPGPSYPAMTLLSQSQSAPRQSSETARGSFDCPPWSRDSRFQEFF